MHELLANWAPPQERSQLGGITYSGAQFGTAAAMIVSGALIHSSGWPSVFYVIGGFSILWFILWCFFIYDSPAEHPGISAEELLYIEKSIGTQRQSKVRLFLTLHWNARLAKLTLLFVYKQEVTPTPWFKIFTSIPVWAIVVGHVGHTWGLYTLLTELPTYMKTVLHFDIKQVS